MITELTFESLALKVFWMGYTFAVVIVQHKRELIDQWWSFTKLCQFNIFKEYFSGGNIVGGNKGFVQIWLLLSFLSSVNWGKSF